ncbi:MAG: adenine phosphoribosyltransferase [Pseudomonadota bacterium]|jgi:adenine phosphoribosyltransferase
MSIHDAEKLIRDVPDFPKPGIVFKDIAPLLADGRAWRVVTEAMIAEVAPWKPEKLAGIESRGFLFSAPLAFELGRGLVLVRKPGKLPWEVVREEYALEYGSDAIEMHVDAVRPGERVVIVDDVLATGGTAAATRRLVERAGGVVVGFAFMVELAFLGGRERLGDVPVASIYRYE